MTARHLSLSSDSVARPAWEEYVEPTAAGAEVALQEIAFAAALGATTRTVPPSLTEFLR